jgi:preprotein translocase subunit SecD
MTRRPYLWLVITLLLVAFAAWVDLSKQIVITNPFNNTMLVNKSVPIQLGLDLRGGLQVLLEADLPATTTISSTDLSTTQQILMNRANALGVSEVVMQSAPPNRIVAQFPGLTNSDQVVAALQETGVLEFVDMGSEHPAEGTVIQTDYRSAAAGPNGIVTQTPTSVASPTPVATDTATPEATAAAGATPAPTEVPAPTIYHTVMAGTSLSTVEVTAGSTVGVTGYVISFTLKPDASTSFGDYTGSHIGQTLAIILDKKVISAPTINAKIDKGSGYIEGNFTSDSANALAIQLRYGSLPVPVKVVESETVGATLGADSVHRSLFAGIVGLLAVVLFMLLYYRLPGFIADLALISYAVISLMLFKLIPVVLSLPGIAGFILGIGMAVDANILIFERLKEELRAGRTLRQAIDLGWSRAWPSIRDANISTLITCLILFIFGNTFGASMVKGFSITLALGIIVSLFTSIIVTRTFLHVVLDSVKFTEHPRWFGITEGSHESN